MNNIITLYHGSERIIEMPEFGKGKEHNDFGFGFYCTENAEAFVNNALSVEQLAQAMRLGKLGEQVVIKSRYACSLLQYQRFDIAEKDIYYTLRKARDNKANQAYYKMAETEDHGLYIRDIVRGEIKNDDPRIPRNLP